jgi:benzoate membrane transport protein
MGALTGAYTVPEQRFAATLTLAVTASGVAAFGIGAAFWGLVAGIGAQLLERLRR